MRRIRELRELHGYTTEELASKLSIGTATLYRYENDKTSLPDDVLQAMADVFGVTTDYILGRETKIETLTSHELSVISALRRGDKISAVKSIVSE